MVFFRDVIWAPFELESLEKHPNERRLIQTLVVGSQELEILKDNGTMWHGVDPQA